MEEKKVEPLKRISLIMQAGRSGDCMDITAEPLTFEFIYGIGSGGLSPFEIELGGKSEGEEVFIPVTGECMSSLFEHLLPPPVPFPDQEARFILKATIQAISDPDPREVIKAMAEAAECGSHCCAC